MSLLEFLRWSEIKATRLNEISSLPLEDDEDDDNNGANAESFDQREGTRHSIEEEVDEITLHSLAAVDEDEEDDE